MPARRRLSPADNTWYLPFCSACTGSNRAAARAGNRSTLGPGGDIHVRVLLTIFIGAVGGLLNGLLVARGGLPSLVVTLGTLALFRESAARAADE